jgi:predicted RNA-binding Zn ribbon-like protein
VNTVDWHLAESLGERLTGYGDLLDWAEQAGLGDVQRLRRHARSRSGAQAHERAIRMRDALFRLFLSVSRGERVDPGDLEVLNGVLSEAMAQASVRATDEGFAWDWTGVDPDRPLWPIARDAAELLANKRIATIGVCHGDGCGWLFLDRTHRRRWCSMADCGNRAKAARHYETVKAQRA